MRTRVSWAARSSPVRSATFSSSCSFSDWSSPSTRRRERSISLNEAASSPSSPRESTWISVSSSSWATRRVPCTSASTGRTTRCLATDQKTAPRRSAISAVTRRLTRRKADRSRSTGSSETPTSSTPTTDTLARMGVAGAGGAVGAGAEGRDHGEHAAAPPVVDPRAEGVHRHGQALVLLVAGAAALGPLVHQLAPLARDRGEGDAPFLVEEPDVVDLPLPPDVVDDGVGLDPLVLHHGVADRRRDGLAEQGGGCLDAGEPLPSDGHLDHQEGRHRAEHEHGRDAEQLRGEPIAPRDGVERGVVVPGAQPSGGGRRAPAPGLLSLDLLARRPVPHPILPVPETSSHPTPPPVIVH